MIRERIKAACSLAGVSLKKGCEISSVKYGTLFTQIDKGREIPFSTIQKLSVGLGIPVSFFDTSTNPPKTPPVRIPGWKLAEQVNAERDQSCRAGFSVNTDHILDWYQREDGFLRNWEWFADQVDLYHPPGPTDSIMQPIRMGRRSITTERLMLSNEGDFMRVVGKFDKKIIDRAMWAHQNLQTHPYIVSDESLDVTVKGQRVQGGYRKVSMRLIDPQGKPINAMFSKLTWLNNPKDMSKVN